jgi:predicted acyl esterase
MCGDLPPRRRSGSGGIGGHRFIVGAIRMIDEIVPISARGGTSIGARIYRPDSSGPYPALLGASPYRFDNNRLPASPQFLWRETGPIEWNVEQGYAYVHMAMCTWTCAVAPVGQH